METKQVTLRCSIFHKRVEVILIPRADAEPRPGIPEGWEAQACLGKDTVCYGKPCPFTIEEDVEVAWPLR